MKLINQKMAAHKHRYFHYLHNSTFFQKDREEYKKTVSKSGSGATMMLASLLHKYEVPKHAVGDFLLLLHAERQDPFLKHGFHIVRSGESRTIDVNGPGLVLTIHNRITKNQFNSLWEQVNMFQDWEVKELGIRSELGEEFEINMFNTPSDFELSFKLYKEKRENPKLTYKKMAELHVDEIGRSNGPRFIEYKVIFVRDLIREMNPQT